jgi:hypothetical protein
MKRGQEIVNERKVFERKFERVFKRALIAQIAPVLRWDNFDNYQDRIPLAIRPDAIEEAMIELYQTTGAYFAAKMKVILTKANQDIWLEEMARYVRTKVANRITWITETSRDYMIEVIRAALGEVTLIGGGISVAASALQDVIERNYGEIIRWRAIRIAQTEVMTASNYAQYKGAQDAENMGVAMVKSWQVSGLRTRDSHYTAERDNQRIPMDQDFVVSGIRCHHPGDPVLPADEVINCACFVIYDPI